MLTFSFFSFLSKCDIPATQLRLDIMSTPPSLPVLTAAQIRTAKKQVLQSWVDAINADAYTKGSKKKAINRQQNVPQLQEAIAHHLNISLQQEPANVDAEDVIIIDGDNSASSMAGHDHIDHELRKKQYQGLLALGEEWKACLEKGKPFKLLSSDGKQLLSIS